MTLVDQLLIAATLIAALSCALMGGIYFAFSNFVMEALARLPAAQAATAMQSLNVVVLNPLFLSLFTGSTALCMLLALCALAGWGKPGCFWLLAAAVLYVPGNFLVTAVCNVPRNKALAGLNPAEPGMESAWQRYVVEWTRWNHVRAITALAAAASLMVALYRLSTS